MLIHSFFIELLGLLATISSVATLLPQIIHTMQTKKVKHISPIMCILGIASSILWIVYSFCIGAAPLLASQFLTLLTKVWLFKLKIKYTKFNKGDTWWKSFLLKPLGLKTKSKKLPKKKSTLG